MIRVTKIPGFVYRVSLQLIAIILCTVAGLYISLTTYILDCFLHALKLLGARVDRDLLKAHTQRQQQEVVYVDDGSKKDRFIDEKESLASSKFPVSPEKLVSKSKELVSFSFGTKKPELLADDFQFIFPVVGPLSKEDFVKAFSSFKVEEAFPNSKENFFGFHVDPTEPNRVWFMSRPTMVHTGTLKFGAKTLKATGKKVVPPPQVLSFSFDKHGLCYKMTGGYSVDRTVGNTGGLGGLFGVMYALGQTLPFPEGQPWKRSPQWEVFYARFAQLQTEWKGLFA